MARRASAKREAPRKLADLETNHLACRSLGHAWDIEVCYRGREGASTVYTVHLRCSRCATTRRDRVVRHEGLDGRTYTHADGYLISNLDKWGGRTIFNSNVRETLYSRLAKPKPRGER